MIAGKNVYQVRGQCKIVECFGLPGAGKSYLSRYVCEILEKNGQRTSCLSTVLGRAVFLRRILGKCSLIVRCLWRNRSATRITFSLIHLHQPAGYGAFVKLLFNWLFVCALIRCETKHFDDIVLDQGVGQALWSTYYYGCDFPDIETVAELVLRLLRELPIFSLLILHVSAEQFCVMRRIESRKHGKSPLDRAYNGCWRRAMKVTAVTRQALDRIVQDSDFVDIIDIDNS